MRWRRKNEPPNRKCPFCLKHIWARLDCHTTYDGKIYYDIDNEPQSVMHRDYGPVCLECYDKEKAKGG